MMFTSEQQLNFAMEEGDHVCIQRTSISGYFPSSLRTGFINSPLTGDTMRYFRPLLADEGGGTSHPLPLLFTKLLDRFSVSKRHMIAPSVNYSNTYITKFLLKVTDDVTRQTEVQIFDYLSSLDSPGKAAAPAEKSPGKAAAPAETKQMKRHGLFPGYF